MVSPPSGEQTAPTPLGFERLPLAKIVGHRPACRVVVGLELERVMGQGPKPVREPGPGLGREQVLMLKWVVYVPLPSMLP